MVLPRWWWYEVSATERSMEVIVVVVVGSGPVVGGVDVETALATISGSSSADFQTPTATDFQELCTEIEDSTCGPSLDRGNKTTDTSHLVLDRTHLRGTLNSLWTCIVNCQRGFIHRLGLDCHFAKESAPLHS